MPAVLIFLVLFSFSASANQKLTLALSHLYTPTISDQIAQNIFLEVPFKWGILDLGAGLNEQWIGVDIAEYKAELRIPIEFFQPFLRASHHVSLSDGYSHSNFMVGASLKAELFSILSLSFSGGMYEKFISQQVTFPFAFNPAIVDSDFFVSLGANLQWAQKWNSGLELSTYDRLRLMNLNTPFVKLTTEWKKDELLSFFVSLRYKILLGFGRFDDWQTMFGMTLRY